MALQRDAKYSGRYDAATPAQPQGAFKNRTSPTSQDGSYMEKDWLNDWSGFFSSLLDEAGFTANNQVDEVGASQYYDALKLTTSGEVSPLNNDWNGFFDPKHQSQLPSTAGYPATSGAGGTVYAADVEWSLGNYSSGAANTISADDDGVIFSVGTYKLFTFTSEQLALIDVNKVPVYLVDETGKRHFLSNATTGVNVTKPDTTTLKVEITNAIFAELGIAKVWEFFVTDGVGCVTRLGVNGLIELMQPKLLASRSWSDVTASRSKGVEYTNQNSYEIIVAISFFGTDNGGEFLVNGDPVTEMNAERGNNSEKTISTVTVPAGATYETSIGPGHTITLWTEFS